MIKFQKEEIDERVDLKVDIKEDSRSDLIKGAERRVYSVSSEEGE